MAAVGKARKNVGACIFNTRQFPAYKTLKLRTKIRPMLIKLKAKGHLPSACVSATELPLVYTIFYLKQNKGSSIQLIIMRIRPTYTLKHSGF